MGAPPIMRRSPWSTSEGVRPALPKNTLMPVTTSRTAAVSTSTAVSCRRTSASGTGSTLDIICDQLETLDDTGGWAEDVVTHHVIDVPLLHAIDCGERGPPRNVSSSHTRCHDDDIRVVTDDVFLGQHGPWSIRLISDVGSAGD